VFFERKKLGASTAAAGASRVASVADTGSGVVLGGPWLHPASNATSATRLVTLTGRRGA
jgi:hypothetical protein